MTDPFQQAALELYEAQRATIPAYDAWCRHELSERAEDAVTTWRDIPALPIAAFKQLEVWAADAPVAATWLSSGTTSEERSTHRLASLDAYDAAIDEGVHLALLPDVVARARDPLACLQLQPDLQHAPNSSLSYMFDRIRTSELCTDAGVFVERKAGSSLRASPTFVSARSSSRSAPRTVTGVGSSKPLAMRDPVTTIVPPDSAASSAGSSTRSCAMAP